MMQRFLILDDNEVFANTLAHSLTRRGFDTTVAHCGTHALQLANTNAFDYVTIDLHLADDSGLQWVAPLRLAMPRARMLVLTGYASIATTVRAIKLGADDYLAKPANVSSILSALHIDADQIIEEATGNAGMISAASNTEAEVSPESDARPLTVNRLEWEHIQRVLSDHEGNISSTARALNMHRRTLQRKLGKRPVSV
jgi:two-component system response regulator RegA